MTKALLKAIQDQIAKITSINYVDEDWSQLDVDDDRTPVKFPCALIDFEDATFEDLGQDRTRVPAQRQTGEIKVIVTIAVQSFSRSNQKAPDSHRDNAAQIYTIMNEVHEKLHGWNPLDTKSGKLKRKEYRTIRTTNGTKQKKMEFSLSVVNV
jgi:hypothetical protein